MTITSHGEIRAPDGWQMVWNVVAGWGDVTYYNSANKDHVISGQITPRHLARYVAKFVQEHCTLAQAKMRI